MSAVSWKGQCQRGGGRESFSTVVPIAHGSHCCCCQACCDSLKKPRWMGGRPCLKRLKEHKMQTHFWSASVTLCKREQQTCWQREASRESLIQCSTAPRRAEQCRGEERRGKDRRRGQKERGEERKREGRGAEETCEEHCVESRCHRASGHCSLSTFTGHKTCRLGHPCRDTWKKTQHFFPPARAQPLCACLKESYCSSSCSCLAKFPGLCKPIRLLFIDRRQVEEECGHAQSY